MLAGCARGRRGLATARPIPRQCIARRRHQAARRIRVCRRRVRSRPRPRLRTRLRGASWSRRPAPGTGARTGQQAGAWRGSIGAVVSTRRSYPRRRPVASGGRLRPCHVRHPSPRSPVVSSRPSRRSCTRPFAKSSTSRERTRFCRAPLASAPSRISRAVAAGLPTSGHGAGTSPWYAANSWAQAPARLSLLWP